jgi:5-methylcytosine-specific restriction endonuclease McrA
MLNILSQMSLITSTAVRDINWETEVAHRGAFVRFLREIPEDFRSIALHRDKRQLVRTHLKGFYMRLPRDQEVDIVLERITNLAFLMERGREAMENKSGQHKFKSEQWQIRKRCEICGHEFTNLQEVTLDHIVPLALGAPEREANWQLACGLCNVQKQEYWGVSDLSRLSSLRGCEGNFFVLELNKAISQLRLKKNPTRYWVLERDNRKCAQCESSSKEAKLCVARREVGFLPTVDNLTAYCTVCADSLRIDYCK